MIEFAELVKILGTSTKTNDKLDALSEYFLSASDKDKVWVIALFSERRPKRIASGSLLAQWCCEISNLPFWLFEESYHTVGDLAEAIALLLPQNNETNLLPHSLSYYLEQITALEKADEATRKNFIVDCWMQMNTEERFVFNKLLTGGFRIGVSQKLMVNALAKTVDTDPSVIAHRISGNWHPSTTGFLELLSEHSLNIDFSKPYPFYLAYALEDDPKTLGEPYEWQAEWKWDGIRGQMIKRNNELFVWSRGEELVTEKFPEYQILQTCLPNGTVLDGEILSFEASPQPHPREGELKNNSSPVGGGLEGAVLPFALLQTRIGRKNIT